MYGPEKYETMIENAGDNNRYQYILLIFIFFIYGATEFITISIPYLEIKPIINYDLDGKNTTKTLTYQICDEYQKLNKSIDIIENKTKSSIVYDFKLYCHESQTAFIGTAIFLGILFGSLLSHYFSDKFGRKYTVIGFGIINVMASFSYLLIYNLYVLYFALFFSGFSYIITALTAMIFLNECLAPNIRSIFSSIIYISYSIFGIIYPLLFESINNWRIIFVIVGGIQLLALIMMWIYSVESPRYLLNKRKFKEFGSVIQIIACKNQISCDTLLNHFPDIEDETPKFEEKFEHNSTDDFLHDLKKKQMKEKNYNLIDLLRYPSQRINFLVTSTIWFSCSFIFYGLAINIKNYEGNIYLEGILINFFEIFVVLLSGYLANSKSLGRKHTISLFLVGGSTSLVISLLIVKETFFYNVLLMITRYCFTSVFCIIYYVTNEIFPTCLRSKGMAMCSVASRFGGIVSPIVLEKLINFKFVIIIYLVLGTISLMFSFSLEETNNKILKDKIPEEIE